MEQKISNLMGDDHIVQQFAVDIQLMRAVQITLYEFMKGFPLAEVLEVQEN
jgi:hypothetical protein